MRISFFRRTNQGTTRLYYDLPGSLNWHQGIDIAIKAFALIKDEIPRFSIFMGRSQKESLEQLIDGLGLKERVRLLGVCHSRGAEKMAGRSRHWAEEKQCLCRRRHEHENPGIHVPRSPVIVSDTRIHKYYFQEPRWSFLNRRRAGIGGLHALAVPERNDAKATYSKGVRVCWKLRVDKRKEEYLNLMDRLAERKSWTLVRDSRFRSLSSLDHAGPNCRYFGLLPHR